MAAIYKDGKIDGRDVRDWYKAWQRVMRELADTKIKIEELQKLLRDMYEHDEVRYFYGDEIKKILAEKKKPVVWPGPTTPGWEDGHTPPSSSRSPCSS